MKLKLTTLLLCLFTATAVKANDLASSLTMRRIVTEALKDGSSEGYVDDNIAKMLGAATGSKEPVFVTMKKVKRYDGGCGRLLVTIKQDGIRSTLGHMPQFEFSICPDGSPPREELERIADAKRASMKSCIAKVEKGGIENSSGALRAVITATGCSANGISHWRYSGECKALEMSRDIDVTYPIDEKGHIDIKLLVPPQCIAANNSWHAIIMDSAKNTLGDIKAKW